MPLLGRAHPFAATAGLLVSLVLPVWAQSPAPATRSIDSVRRLPPIAQAVRTRASAEVTFDWSASAGAPASAAADSRGAMPALHGFQMQGSRQAADPPQRERDPQIGPDDIVFHDSLIHESILAGIKASGAVRRPGVAPAAPAPGQTVLRLTCAAPIVVAPPPTPEPRHVPAPSPLRLA